MTKTEKITQLINDLRDNNPRVCRDCQLWIREMILKNLIALNGRVTESNVDDEVETFRGGATLFIADNSYGDECDLLWKAIKALGTE